MGLKLENKRQQLGRYVFSLALGVAFDLDRVVAERELGAVRVAGNKFNGSRIDGLIQSGAQIVDDVESNLLKVWRNGQARSRHWQTGRLFYCLNDNRVRFSPVLSNPCL